MANICKYKGKRVLLVEGKNDCHVIMALCQHYSLPETFGIYVCENDINILKRLNALTIQPDHPETIGIVIDTDNPDVARRWQQIRQKIFDHGYSFRQNPDSDGTVLPDNPGKPRLGIWLMPNNEDPGMLEDFLMKMADEDALATASQCLDTAMDKGLTFFKDIHFSKALIHTYLAWQDEPGKPLGQSITSHALKPDTEIAKVFVKWLKRLFDL